MIKQNKTQNRPLIDLTRSARPVPMLVTALLVVVLVVFLIVPIALVIGSGFTLDGKASTYWLGRTLVNKVQMQQLANGLGLAAITTLVCMIISLPLALLRTRCRFWGQSLFDILILLPMILPPFVGGMAMHRLLGKYGVLNLLLDELGMIDLAAPPDWLGSGFVGVVILQVLHLFPITYLNASAALANLDPTYRQAAQNLGAGPLTTFFRITLPLIRPGLFAGSTIVFIWAFTDIGTPLIIGYQDLVPVQIFKDLAQGDYSPQTYSLVFVMLVASMVLYVIGKFVFGRGQSVQSSKASLAPESIELRFWGTLGAWTLFGVIILLSLLPHVGVVLIAVSDRWVGTILPTQYTWAHLQSVITGGSAGQSMLNSLKYAGVSTLIDIILGCVAAWLIVRIKVLGRTVLDTLVMLPLAVPGIILAAGYLAMTVKGSPLEGIGPMRNPFALLVIAYSIRRLPFIVRGVSAGLQQIPESLEEAARNLGASKAQTVMRVTVPLLTASIIAAAVLTFSFAMLEVSDSLILAQLQEDYPITKEIYRLANNATVDSLNSAAALGVYGMVLLGGAYATASLLMGRRLGAIFRA